MNSESAERPEYLEAGSYKELRLLEEVQQTPEVTQRHLALKLGVALGVANALLRGLARKGYIRTTQVGWKRWVYVVTPAGVRRKVHLTYGYIESFLGHYKRVRTLLSEDLGNLPLGVDSMVAVYGTSELAEIVYLALQDIGINRVDFIEESPCADSFLGRPLRALESVSPDDYVKIIIAATRGIEQKVQLLGSIGIQESRIVGLLQQNLVETVGPTD